MQLESNHTNMTPQQRRLTQGGFAQYRQFAVGDKAGLSFFAWYELLTLFSGVPGILGYGLRATLYRSLFAKCGARPAFGRGVVIRNPLAISLGNKVMVDDYAVLDVRGAGALEINDFVSIGRFTTLAAKEGQITLGSGSNIGSYCRIATQSQVSIGKSVLIGAYSYIGAGNHQPGDSSVPLIEREMEIKGGVSIGDHAWIGAGAMILDGVSIGEGAIVGAKSLVLESVPAHTTVAGTPARVIESKAHQK